MVEPVYAPVVVAGRTAFKAWGLKIDIQGEEHIPEAGPAVLASNHISYLDFIFSGLAAVERGRYCRFMAKDSVWENPVGGFLMRGMKHIPVDRAAGAASMAAGVAALEQGEVIGVFPEATISQSYELKGFKLGAARMAAIADAPLLPVVVWGTQRMYTKGRPRDLRRGLAISVRVGEPLRPGTDDDPAAVTEELKARMTELLEKVITDYPQHPRDPADTWWLPARLGGTAPTPQEAAAMEVAERKARAAAARAEKAAAEDSPAS